MLILSPSSGLVGDEITIMGCGYSYVLPPGKYVFVTWDYGGISPLNLTTTPSPIYTDYRGEWEATFNVPPGYAPGTYTVYAEDSQGVYATVNTDTPGFFVIPELYFGTIMGLVACLAALSVFLSKRLNL